MHTAPPSGFGDVSDVLQRLTKRSTQAESLPGHPTVRWCLPVKVQPVSYDRSLAHLQASQSPEKHKLNLFRNALQNASLCWVPVLDIGGLLPRLTTSCSAKAMLTSTQGQSPHESKPQ